MGGLSFSKEYVVVPTMGGILADVPLSARDQRRFPAEVCLPVTLAAVGANKWVVVEYEGHGVAMTASQAVERGLVEAPHWVPDLTGVGIVPAEGEILEHLKARKGE